MSHVIDSANWTVGRPPKRARTSSHGEHSAHRCARRFTSNVDDGYLPSRLWRRLGRPLNCRRYCRCRIVHARMRRIARPSRAVRRSMRCRSLDRRREKWCNETFRARELASVQKLPLLMDLYDEFVKQIETGKSLLPTFEEALETQRVLAHLGYTTAS